MGNEGQASPEQEEIAENALGQENGAGVGALLRASRERCGEDLRDVAQMLRIRYPYLEAIEDGRFNDLPGQAYAIGFIRAYAEHLGLDSAEVVRRFKGHDPDKSSASELVFPSPMPETGIPGGAILLVGVVVAVLAYGGWYLSTVKEGFLSDLISPLPERLAVLLPDGDSSPSEQPVKAPENPKPVSAPPEKITKQAEPPQSSPAVVESSPAADQSNSSEPAPTSTVATTSEQSRTGNTESPGQITTSETSTPGNGSSETTAPQSTATADTEGQTQMEATPEQPADTPQASAPEAEQAVEQPASEATEPATSSANAGNAVSSDQASTGDATATPAASGPEPAQTGETSEPEISKPTAPASAEATQTAEPTPDTAQQSTQQASAASSRVFGSDTGKSRIEIKAKIDSWIQVRDDIGNTLLLTRLLRAGDSYRVPDRAGLTLSTGNAGALEILVDGSVVPAIGNQGSVRRGIALDADKLKAGSTANN